MKWISVAVVILTAYITAATADNLASLLKQLQFKNSGIVKSTDAFQRKKIPCEYLEPEEVPGVQASWGTTGSHMYLYQAKNTTLVPPPSGMRSAVPLGGISTGSMELRADGSLHEWTIMNQHPAGAAKFAVVEDAFFGLFTSTQQKNKKQKHKSEYNILKEFKEFKDKNVKDKAPASTAFTLRTHPSQSFLPAVAAMSYSGSHPVSRLKVLDQRLDIEATLYAYSTYSVGDMQTSATPAIAFSLVLDNPTSETVDASLMFNIPFGIEKLTTRLVPEGTVIKNSFTQQLNDKYSKFDQRWDMHDSIMNMNKKAVPWALSVNTDEDCFNACHQNASCQTWVYNASGSCLHFNTVNLNQYASDAKGNSSSGIKGYWEVSNLDTDQKCLSLVRPGNAAPNGNLTLCPTTLGDPNTQISFMTATSLESIWNQFSEYGSFTNSPITKVAVHGAAAVKTTLLPGESKTITIILSWYYPNRDLVGKVYGNWYSNLFRDSIDVAQAMMHNLPKTLQDISLLHSAFFKEADETLPEWLQDLYINSLNHIRSAAWWKDGRWRQWEAYDCTNIDSIHNDGERHIPYIMFFPWSTVNKMHAWSLAQGKDGMIAEQLRCTQSGPSQQIDTPCGRVMSDVSSMFMVYLLELYKWGNDVQTLESLWPTAKRAAIWHMNVSTKYGIPYKIQNTYDVLGLQVYPVSTYNAAFHLLAMKVGQELATIVGDTAFATECAQALLIGQAAIDKLLWNETGQYYMAYAYAGETPDHGGRKYQARRLLLDEPEAPSPLGALMVDAFYAQVLAYSLGLGSLVNETRLSLHMKAELDHNDTPYGLMVMTGRQPYPGNAQDNAIWMMGNPNWATITMHLGEDPGKAMAVAKKSLNRWQSYLKDQWNVAGIMGGLNYSADGQPYITSHYGYYMSSWHILFALSGQQADVPNGRLTFDNKLGLTSFSYPVLLPGVLGTISGKPQGQSIEYELALKFGSLTLKNLAVKTAVCDQTPLILTAGKSVRWFGPQQ